MFRRSFLSIPLAALARARNASAPLAAASEVNGNINEVAEILGYRASSHLDAEMRNSINTSLHPKITYDPKVLNKLSKKFVVRSRVTKPGDEVLFL